MGRSVWARDGGAWEPLGSPAPRGTPRLSASSPPRPPTLAQPRRLGGVTAAPRVPPRGARGPAVRARAGPPGRGRRCREGGGAGSVRHAAPGRGGREGARPGAPSPPLPLLPLLSPFFLPSPPLALLPFLPDPAAPPLPGAPGGGGDAGFRGGACALGRDLLGTRSVPGGRGRGARAALDVTGVPAGNGPRGEGGGGRRQVGGRQSPGTPGAEICTPGPACPPRRGPHSSPSARGAAAPTGRRGTCDRAQGAPTPGGWRAGGPHFTLRPP